MWTKSKVVFCAIIVLVMVIIGRAYWEFHVNETLETKNDQTDIIKTMPDKTQKITVESITEGTTDTEETENNQVEIETDKGVDIEFNEESTTEPPSDTTNDIIEDTNVIEDTGIVEDTTEITSVPKKPVFYLSDNERRIVECIVMGESGYEPYEGQVLVAQCLLNACLKDNLQPSEVRTKYQYRGWMDNPTDSVKQAVSAVFDDGYRLTDELILYFYSPKYSKGKWHETQRFIMEFGGHRFFAEWDK